MIALNVTPMNGSRTSFATASHNGSGIPVIGMFVMEEQHRERVPEEGSGSVRTARNWPAPVLDEIEVERSRLEAEIVAAISRTVAAQHRAGGLDADVRTGLREEFINSRESLADMEREHEAAVAMIRDTAKGEIERIRAEAADAIATAQSEASKMVVWVPAPLPREVAPAQPVRAAPLLLPQTEVSFDVKQDPPPSPSAAVPGLEQ